MFKKNKSLLIILMLLSRTISAPGGAGATGAGVGAMGISSSNPDLTTLYTAAIVTSAVLGIIATVGTILSTYSGFGFSDKSSVKNAQKYSKKILTANKGLKLTTKQLSDETQNYNVIAQQLQALENDSSIQAEAKKAQEEVLLNTLDKSEKKISSLQEKQQKLIDDKNLYEAYLDSIEKKAGGNLKTNFLAQETKNAVDNAAIQIVGTTNPATLSQDQINAIEQQAVANIKKDKKGLLQRFKNAVKKLGKKSAQSPGAKPATKLGIKPAA